MAIKKSWLILFWKSNTVLNVYARVKTRVKLNPNRPPFVSTQLFCNIIVCHCCNTILIELDLVMIMNAQVHCTQLTLSVQCTNAQPTVNRIELCSFHQSVTNNAVVSLG